MLAVHSEDNELTFGFARRFKSQNDRNLSLAQASGETKLPGAARSLRTLLVSTLLEVEEERRLQQKGAVPASITAYNFNNGKSQISDFISPNAGGELSAHCQLFKLQGRMGGDNPTRMADC